MAGVLAAVSLAVTVRLGAPHYTRGGLDAYVLDVGQVLYLMYRESGDKELLFILGGMLFL